MIARLFVLLPFPSRFRKANSFLFTKILMKATACGCSRHCEVIDRARSTA